MAWPLSQDYNEAIQSPAANFATPSCKRGEAVANALGLPMPCSGNFADVYEVRCPARQPVGRQVLHARGAGLRERYHEISRHLQQAKLPFTVDFNYLEQGHPHRRPVVSRPQDALGRGADAQPVREPVPRQAGHAGGAAAALGPRWPSTCAAPMWATATCSTATSCWCPAASANSLASS